MNYIAAASERNLDLAQLPKTVQKKIQELESLVNEYATFKDIPRESLNEKELESLTLIEEKISDLDALLVKKVKSFDPVKYQEKVERFNSMLEVKANKKKEKLEKQVPQEEKLQEPNPEPLPEPTPNVEPLSASTTPVQTAASNEKTTFETPKNEEEDDLEVEEFDKVEDVKPKKNGKNMIILGVGILFLTWGAVNIFKNRRG